MGKDFRKTLLEYLMAILAVAIAVVLRWFFDIILNGDHALPTLFGAVAFAVWYGGFAPALFASVLGYLAVDYLFIEPRGAIAVHTASDFVGFLFYFSSCLIIIAFGSGMRAAQSRAEANALSALARKDQLGQEMVERQRAEAALKNADQRKDEFLATLAHELRNPLAPIRNAVHIMQMGTDGPAAHKQMLGMMERQVGHMVRLIDDLLDVSRISRGKIELRKERLNLADVVEVAVETSRPLVDAEKHEIAVTLPPQSLYVMGDKVRLAQVFANLLNNSAKYTPSGGHIWLTLERQKDQAVIRVRDDGIGIPTEMLPSIFELFMQVDHHLKRSQGGLGIGLSLARRLIDMHGGTIQVHSDGPGRGSDFVVRLPIAADMLPEPRAEEVTGDAAVFTRHRILVADDNRESADSLSMLLTLMGNEVRTTYGGFEAVEMATMFHPDVIVLDIGMPGLNGFEAARQIRQQCPGKGAVMVALTGWGQEEDRKRSREAGFDLHVVKPVDSASLGRLLCGLQEEAI